MESLYSGDGTRGRLYISEEFTDEGDDYDSGLRLIARLLNRWFESSENPGDAEDPLLGDVESARVATLNEASPLLGVLGAEEKLEAESTAPNTMLKIDKMHERRSSIGTKKAS